jgi:phosphatidylglycerol---prolipoprotein diacylglyceryl transferase
MRRVLFRWGRLTLYSYPTMLTIGIVVGLFAQQAVAARIGLDVPRSTIATLLLLTPALFGARLLFVVSHWGEYRRQPRRIWQTSAGGAAMYGGLILAVPLSVPVLAILDLSFGAFWDAVSFTILVGMVITRVGCFLNGCCGGKPTNRWYGINLANDRGVWQRRIPTQPLEAAWGLIVLIGAVLIRSFPFPGALFLYTVSGYALGRVALESAREEQDQALGLRVNQVISFAFAAIALVVAIATAWRD